MRYNNTNISPIKANNFQPDYSDDEREFMVAMDKYKRKYHRLYPTCTEVLEVLKSLGYSKNANKPACGNNCENCR